MTNNRKRKHHFIPRLYLKGFVDKLDPSFVWVYERGKAYKPGYKPNNNPYKRPINQAGMEPDYYAYPLRNGELDLDTYENWLEQLEKPANQIFAKLRQQEMITKKEKKAFASYISLMIKRIPRYRERADALWPEFISEFEASSIIRAQIKQIEANLNPDDVDGIAKIERLKEQYNQVLAEYKQGIPKEILLGTIVRQGLLPRVIYSMKWQLLVAQTGMDYVTSDNPVSFFEPFGLSQEYSELTFPISSEIALIASNKNLREGFFPAPPLAALEINQRTISGATKQVYYCRDTDWFLKIFNPE